MRKAHDTLTIARKPSIVMAVKRTALGKRKRGARVPAKMSATKLQAQVRRLMRIRQEKKFFDYIHPGDSAVGQVNAAVTGSLVQDITPVIAQGDGESQRIGNSITGTGMVVKQQFLKQFNAIGPRKVRTHVVRVLDPGMSATDVLVATLSINVFSGVRDYFSELNYAMMRDKRVQVLGTKEARLESNFSDNNTELAERSTADLILPVKFEDQTVRYEADGDNLPANIRYFTITLVDIGNGSTGTASTLPVFVKSAQSGVDYKMSSRFWYTDS